MKKSNLLLTLVFTIIAISSEAQLVIFKASPGDKKYGISSKMTYQAIVSSGIKQKELINKTKDFFISAKLIDEKKLKTNEISDKLSEFTLPFGFRQGVYFGKGAMGARFYKAPSYLFFDANFKFNAEGKILITFTNFRERPFFQILSNKYFVDNVSIEEQIKGTTSESEEIIKCREEIIAKYQTSTAETSPLSKALLLITSGLDNYKKNLDDINKDLDSQFEVYDKAVKLNAGKWFVTPQECISYMDENNDPNRKWYIPMAKERAEANYLLVIDNERWNNYFENIFNGVFVNIANLTNGKIEGIQKDGEAKYNYVNGKLEKVKK